LLLHIDTPLLFLDKFQHHDPPEHQIVTVFIGMSDAQPVVDPFEFVSHLYSTLEEVHQLIQEQPVTPWLRDGSVFLAEYLNRVN
jgi:hypothetical protein